MFLMCVLLYGLVMHKLLLYVWMFTDIRQTSVASHLLNVVIDMASSLYSHASLYDTFDETSLSQQRNLLED